MSKIAPEERWRKHVTERYEAFKLSGELRKLRAEGLKILKRTKLYTPEEWNVTFHERAYSQEFRAWYDKCKNLGDRFGLDQSTVELACLFEGYDPERMPFILESEWPRIRIVTENTDLVFLTRLAYEVQRLGLHVIQRQGSVESTYLLANPVPIMFLESPPLPTKMPTLHSAFYVRVETPVLYPPEGAAKLHKKAGQHAKEILKRLGYSIPQRLRASNLISQAPDLKVEEANLPSGGIYDIMDHVYGDDITQDQERRKRIKSRRNKLKKRLIDPYKPKDENSEST
jgi:hypothetical protein